VHASNSYLTDEDADFDFWNIEVDTSDPPEDIAGLVEDVENPEEGFFGPDSMMWRINRENARYIVGPTAALLQLGHPKVAAGVARHSDFSEDPNARFERTFEIVDAIMFGDLETALEAAMLVRKVHDWVTGELQEDLGRWGAGDPYEANEPENLLWVHATLIEQALVAYETYVEELTDAEKERYYQESKIFGQLFGVPAEDYPETLDGFFEYYETELEEAIDVGERGAEQRDLLLEISSIPGIERSTVLGKVKGFLGAATMPEPAREAFGFEWDGRRQRLFDAFAWGVRRVYPNLPDRIRYNEKYRRNLDRLRKFHEVRLEPGRPIAAPDSPSVASPAEGPAISSDD
jgi:uncharacterized protein (DUF2236 family)